MDRIPMRLRAAATRTAATAGLAVAALATASGAAAQPTAADLDTRALAATCASCHGTDGRAVEGQPMVRLAGQQAAYISEQRRAFRDGKRPATVMHQLTKGYTDAQIDQIAAYFAAIK